jgi:hypothetical protein
MELCCLWGRITELVQAIFVCLVRGVHFRQSYISCCAAAELISLDTCNSARACNEQICVQRRVRRRASSAPWETRACTTGVRSQVCFQLCRLLLLASRGKGSQCETTASHIDARSLSVLRGLSLPFLEHPPRHTRHHVEPALRPTLSRASPLQAASAVAWARASPCIDCATAGLQFWYILGCPAKPPLRWQCINCWGAVGVLLCSRLVLAKDACHSASCVCSQRFAVAQRERTLHAEHSMSTCSACACVCNELHSVLACICPCVAPVSVHVRLFVLACCSQA